MIDGISPVTTEGARKWIKDLAGQFQRRASGPRSCSRLIVCGSASAKTILTPYEKQVLIVLVYLEPKWKCFPPG